MGDSVIPRCGRCGGEIEGPNPDVCWFCQARLCADCWEAYGHCGHQEADEENDRARLVKQPKSGRARASLSQIRAMRGRVPLDESNPEALVRIGMFGQKEIWRLVSGRGSTALYELDGG